MYDMHVHSDFSIDTDILMEDMVKSAVEKNGKTICFTDHVEFGVGPEKIDVVFRTDDFFKKFRQLRYSYADRIEILAGAELGLQPGELDKYRDFSVSAPFDFLIAAIHTVRHMDVYSELIRRYPTDEALRMYYEDMLECVTEFDNFDALAHIDYIDRYLPQGTVLPAFDEYRAYVEPVLSVLIEKGKALEVNTGGLRRLDYAHPKTEILKLYAQMGGEILTFASDAHKPADIYYEYRSTEKMLKELGFKYIFKYKERKKYPIHLM